MVARVLFSRNEIWIAPLNRARRELSNGINDHGAQITPRGSKTRKQFAPKAGKSGDSPKHEILPRWKSDTLKVFPRPKLLADRNANLRFDLAFTVLPPNHDLCPKTPIFSAASSNFRLQPKFRLHH